MNEKRKSEREREKIIIILFSWRTCRALFIRQSPCVVIRATRAGM